MAVGSIFFMPRYTQAQEKQAPMNNPTIQANNDFSCVLYRNLIQENVGKNLFFSPYSLSTALAMTLEGARGQTADEMGKVLSLPASLRQTGPEAKSLPWKMAPYQEGFLRINRRLMKNRDAAQDQNTRAKLAGLRQKLAKLNDQLADRKIPGNDSRMGQLRTEATQLADSINSLNKLVDLYELRVANAVWGEKSYPFDPNYLMTIGKYFGSDALHYADFKMNFPAERNNINRWVLQQTDDRIKDLIAEIAPEVARRIRLILVNAIFFKGQWANPFDAKRTKKEPFLLNDGGKTEAWLMHVNNKQASYAAFNADGSFFKTPSQISLDPANKVQTYPEGDGFFMVELPVKGDKISMVVIAPQNPGGLEALEARLKGDSLNDWIGKLEKRTVEVALPKFKLETEYSLKETLIKMGMSLAFAEGRADFTGMSNSPNPDDRLSISKVLQKAFLEVNELGAEAAAATTVIMIKSTAFPVTRPFIPNFRADRPFIFLFRDMESGTILFMGRVTQPPS